LGRQGVGALAALSAAAFSSIAGVYFEGLVKARETTAPSLWARNVQLCVFTIPLAAFGAAMKLRQSPHAPVAAAFTAGFDAPTVLLVVLNASGGLLVAAVIKYGDNILKNFTTSCSVILGTLISIFLFDFRPTLQFGWGSAIVIGAAYLYAVGVGASAPVEKEADAARRLLEESEAGSPEGSRADSRRSSIESV
jgi:UDP-sugar transporter A1/2/3